MDVEALAHELPDISAASRGVKIIELPLPQREVEFLFEQKPVYEFFKRAFDILCSLAALIVTGPILLFIMLLIYLNDKGNPIFVQERVGKDGKLFKMYKLRTMVVGAEKQLDELIDIDSSDGPVLYKPRNDPRITKLGAFLRRSSLDELVQLVNVLKGEMSIIGPRPMVPPEHAAGSPLQQKRVLVKPGLSCYSVLDEDSRDSYERWVNLDLKYIRERSFPTDFMIIFRTIGVLILHKNF